DLGDVMDISSDEEAPNTAPPQPVNFTVDMIVQALQDVQKLTTLLPNDPVDAKPAELADAEPAAKLASSLSTKTQD
ncbi:unnamed protein product, partial [Durusdinium trenchii]